MNIKKVRWVSNKDLTIVMPANTDKVNESIYLRKTFTAEENVKKAELNICALGLGVCHINGKPVTEDVLSTLYTAYDKRVLYNVYDVTELIKRGENAIGVHVGNGFYNDNAKVWNDMMAPWRATPRLAVELNIEYESGITKTIFTDDTWKTEKGPCIYNHMRQGERYDANLRADGYSEPDFDDNSWQNAIAVAAPGGVLEKNDSLPIRVCKVIKPISKTGDIYDFGENISGWANIKLTGEKGQTVSVKYDEALNENGDFVNANSIFINNPIMMNNEDIFICSGKENEEYRPQFCYHGFRYVKVENAPENLEITAEFVHTDFDVVGEFATSNEMLNKIHDMSIRSILSNFVGLPTDCPHREQNGWTGDALISCDQTLMNFDANKAYYKWLNDFKDAQRPSGQLPGIIPSPGWGYNWGSGPGWDSALILMPYKIYLITGDMSIIKNMWDNMTLYMDYMEAMETRDGTVCYGLGDWASPDKDSTCPTEVVETATYYADLSAMAYMAKLLGKDSEVWEKKAVRVRNAWRNCFLDKDEYKKYQAYYAIAIYNGLLDDSEVAVYAKNLAELVKSRDYHIYCGIIGAKALFDALSNNGYADVVYKMVVNPTYPGYGWWVKNGMTTLCEYWDMKMSKNHHMYSEVENWFYRHIAGIRFERDGLIIKPCLLDDVPEFKAHHRGISVERNGNRIHIKTDRKVSIIINGTSKEYMQGEYSFDIN